MLKTELMCGITGILSFDREPRQLERIGEATRAIAHRGPDGMRHQQIGNVALGHARLSIIDTSEASAQPFTDATGRYTIVFNGEIFNYVELRKELESGGITFRTSGDVEVLLQLFMLEKENGLNKVRGFFAFAVYDADREELFVARDRFGVKPLYFLKNNKAFAFASEIRSLFAYGFKFSINTVALYHYLQLNYIPGDASIANEIQKLPPAGFCYVSARGSSGGKYYDLHSEIEREKASAAKNPEERIRELLESSVKDRLVADVPVGCFLSGGIDSTVIAGIASKLKPGLSTFCLGFSGNKWFDESPYAEKAAASFGTDHHTFMLGNDDLLSHLDDFLESVDEPFADSSALNVFILSRKTRHYVKTVLSGDGADELFAGYNKHRAEWLICNSADYRFAAGAASVFSSLLPKSRNTGFSNKVRQISKFAETMKLGAKERYWHLACISPQAEARSMMACSFDENASAAYMLHLLRHIRNEESLGDFLATDIEIVLEGDMLVKVDRMSMACGLEVRNPFLDHRLVAWALALPDEFKINRKSGKIILKKAFASLIPAELLMRKKHGFEVPLHKWMKNELRGRIEAEYLSQDMIAHPGIFSVDAVTMLKKQLYSENPGDAPARAWAIIVFNHWYKKYGKHFD